MLNQKIENNFFRKMLKKIIPIQIRSKIYLPAIFLLRYEFKYRVYRFLKNNISFDEIEIRKILDYTNDYFWNIDMIAYNYKKRYNYKNITVYKENNCKYVLINDKKLFWKKDIDDEKIKKMVNNLLIEQDEQSPHKYIEPKKDFILADLGAAEGIFALLNIEKVKKVYLFEGDPEWIEPLRLTFDPYKDKVEIINKFVSDVDSGDYITLDTFFKNKKIDYVKADIEGFELNMLNGAKETFNKVKMASICAYHKYNDEKNIRKFFKPYNFNIGHSNGYIISERPCYTDDCKEPYLRRGVMYLTK